MLWILVIVFVTASGKPSGEMREFYFSKRECLEERLAVIQMYQAKGLGQFLGSVRCEYFN